MTKKSTVLATKAGNSDHKPAEKPVSLHPLKFEEAVTGLLKVRRGEHTVRRDKE